MGLDAPSRPTTSN